MTSVSSLMRLIIYLSVSVSSSSSTLICLFSNLCAQCLRPLMLLDVTAVDPQIGPSSRKQPVRPLCLHLICHVPLYLSITIYSMFFLQLYLWCFSLSSLQPFRVRIRFLHRLICSVNKTCS
jgi:hypothetical protein